MKKLIILVMLVSALFANVVKSPIVSVDEKNSMATIQIDKADIGMSGFVVHKLDETHGAIVKNAVVESYDKNTKMASLKLYDFDMLKTDALPNGKWHVKKGDTVVLAFGYKRAFLVAPNEEIYYRVVNSAKNIEWIHPDIFATILSINGHPTPLKSDFKQMNQTASVGILFFFLERNLFTLDANSFEILNISDAMLLQESVQLPFYTRVKEIDANWWGEGSSKLKDYETYYYELITQHNKKSKKLYEIIKNSDKKLHYLLKEFEIGNVK